MKINGKNKKIIKKTSTIPTMIQKKSAIQRYENSSGKQNLIKNLRIELEIIDKEIFAIMSGLLEAQKVQIKSTLSQDKNWITKLQKKWVLSAASKSAGWHKERLSFLIKQRKKIQIRIDKLTGDYWPKKIRIFFFLSAIIVVLIIFIALTMMSIMMAIYLMPVWIILIITYLFSKKNILSRR